MKNRNKWLWFVFFSMPSLLLQPAQFFLKKVTDKKTLKISVMTRSFLKNMINLEQNFSMQSDKCQGIESNCLAVCNSMIDLNRKLYDQGEISTVDRKELFAFVSKIQTIVAVQKNRVIDCVLQAQALHQLWNYLKSCLGMSIMLGYDADRVWLQQQIDQVDAAVQKGKAVDPVVLMRSVKVCSTIMHQFDGVMVTDFDFVMLANLMLVFALLRC